jgi:AcrR family transcriptional regulator
MIETKETWIKVGYQLFALSGEHGLKIETIAKKVGISKSSFYHYFADLELFTEQLMDYHVQQSILIAEKENNAQNIDPEVIAILLEHKTDVLFSRQLRFHQQRTLYRNALQQSTRHIGSAFVQIWAKELQLQLSQQQLEGLYELALDNFYAQATPDNLHYDWLSAYFAHVNRIAANFIVT